MQAPEHAAPSFPSARRSDGDLEAARARLARWSLGLLAVTVGAVLFGAVVRITGSGAGCGQHWPTCQGEVAHLPQTVEAAIELTHRVTSAGAGLLAFAVAWPAFRLYPKAHPVRWALGVACAFMVVEGLIGMLIVRGGLVGENASVGRALFVPLHLVSTSVLTGAVALAARWSARGLPSTPMDDVVSRRLVALGLGGILLVSAFGAVTALGDTLYPAAAPFSGALGSDTATHFLERLRVVHPLVAVVVAAFLFTALPRVRDRNRSQEISRWVTLSLTATAVQMLLGLVNVLLGAPGWMQVLHLLVACLLWISLVILASELGAFSASWRRAAR